MMMQTVHGAGIGRARRGTAQAARPERASGPRLPGLERFLRGAVAHAERLTEFSTVSAALRRGRTVSFEVLPRAPRAFAGSVADVSEALAHAEEAARACAARLTALVPRAEVARDLWSDCWRDAARGWAHSVRSACRRCADSHGIDWSRWPEFTASE